MLQNVRPEILGAMLLAACAPSGSVPEIGRLEDPAPIVLHGAEGPPDAAAGTCWGRDETPATLETTTEDIVVAPAILDPDGVLLTPAVTETRTRQRIVEPRGEVWFETPCPASLTADNVATLQRALAARGLYQGPITGSLDAETRNAIRRYQQPLGLDSSVLSLAAARRLGLVTVASHDGNV